MSQRKRNCWEARKCGREPGGTNAQEQGVCPAASDGSCDGINDGRNAGRLCWVVAGTLCEGRIQGTYAERISTCRDCSFFREVKYEQGCYFQMLKPGMGTFESATLHRRLNDTVGLMSLYRDILAGTAALPLLKHVVEQAHRITGSEASAAYSLSERTSANPGEPKADSSEMDTELVLEAHAGDFAFPERIALSADSPVALAVCGRGPCQGPVNVPDSGGQARLLAMPVGGEYRPAGALVLVKSGGGFSTDDEWFLQELALIAALGLRNARQVGDLRELRGFTRNASRSTALLMHQIGSPLATIACSLEALSQVQDLSEEDRQKLISFGLDGVEHVHSLIQRLMDLERIRAGGYLLPARPVRVAPILRSEVEGRMAQARQKRLDVELRLDDPQATIQADPEGLRLIFGNLLDNAIKYTENKGERIEISAAVRNRRLRISVSDDGIGIPSESQSRVFDEFYRASVSTVRQRSEERRVGKECRSRWSPYP